MKLYLGKKETGSRWHVSALFLLRFYNVEETKQPNLLPAFPPTCPQLTCQPLSLEELENCRPFLHPPMGHPEEEVPLPFCSLPHPLWQYSMVLTPFNLVAPFPVGCYYTATSGVAILLLAFQAGILLMGFVHKAGLELLPRKIYPLSCSCSFNLSRCSQQLCKPIPRYSPDNRSFFIFRSELLKLFF